MVKETAREFKPNFSGAKKTNQVIRVVFDVNMNNGHFGLKEIAKKLKVNFEEMEVGDLICFLNTAKTIVKIVAAGGTTIAHFKHPLGHAIDMRTLSLIPKFFNGKELQYDKAIEEILGKELNRIIQ